MVLSIRAEFYNIFNRVALTPPSVGGFFGVNTNTAPSATTPYTAGYGFINMVPSSAGMAYVEQPRSGQMVARLTF